MSLKLHQYWSLFYHQRLPRLLMHAREWLKRSPACLETQQRSAGPFVVQNYDVPPERDPNRHQQRGLAGRDRLGHASCVAGSVGSEIAASSASQLPRGPVVYEVLLGENRYTHPPQPTCYVTPPPLIFVAQPSTAARSTGLLWSAIQFRIVVCDND